MKHLIPLALFTLVFAACKQEQQNLSSTSAQEDGLSVESVEDCFSSYRKAILDQDGDTAVTFLSNATIHEYQRYVDWALTAEQQELESLSFINRMQVIILRHRIPLETLRSLDGRSAIIYAVDRDWIGKDSVIRTKVGKIEITDNRATSEVIIGGQKAPNRFQFRYEGDSWKFDLISLLRDSNTAMKGAAKQAGLSEDEFLFTILESISGEKVDESIWMPPN